MFQSHIDFCNFCLPHDLTRVPEVYTCTPWCPENVVWAGNKRNPAASEAPGRANSDSQVLDPLHKGMRGTMVGPHVSTILDPQASSSA
jgi:hypothetical protein